MNYFKIYFHKIFSVIFSLFFLISPILFAEPHKEREEEILKVLKSKYPKKYYQIVEKLFLDRASTDNKNKQEIIAKQLESLKEVDQIGSEAKCLSPLILELVFYAPDAKVRNKAIKILYKVCEIPSYSEYIKKLPPLTDNQKSAFDNQVSNLLTELNSDEDNLVYSKVISGLQVIPYILERIEDPSEKINNRINYCECLNYLSYEIAEKNDEGEIEAIEVPFEEIAITDKLLQIAQEIIKDKPIDSLDDQYYELYESIFHTTSLILD